MGLLDKIGAASATAMVCGVAGLCHGLRTFDSDKPGEQDRILRRAAIVWPLAWVAATALLFSRDNQQDRAYSDGRDAWVADCVKRSASSASQAECFAAFDKAAAMGRD